jgi:hypothetical protein
MIKLADFVTEMKWVNKISLEPTANQIQIFLRQYYDKEPMSDGGGSAVGIATRYELDGPRIESRWGRDFPHSSRMVLWPTQPPTQWVPDLSRGKADGAWRWPPTPSSAKVKERVELYLYSNSGPYWPVLGWSLHMSDSLWTDSCALFSSVQWVSLPGAELDTPRVMSSLLKTLHSSETYKTRCE